MEYFVREDLVRAEREKKKHGAVAAAIAVGTAGGFVVGAIFNIGWLMLCIGSLGGCALLFELCVNFLPAKARYAMTERVMTREANEEIGVFDRVESREHDIEGKYFDDIILLTEDKRGQFTEERKLHVPMGATLPEAGQKVCAYTVSSIVKEWKAV